MNISTNYDNCLEISYSWTGLCDVAQSDIQHRPASDVPGDSKQGNLQETQPGEASYLLRLSVTFNIQMSPSSPRSPRLAQVSVRQVTNGKGRAPLILRCYLMDKFHNDESEVRWTTGGCVGGGYLNLGTLH